VRSKRLKSMSHAWGQSMISSSENGTLVIGAAQGIGEASARHLARQAWCGPLVLADRQYEKVEAVAESIRSAGGNAKAFSVDLSDHRTIVALADAAGPITRVALVAGVIERKPAREMTADAFERVMRINTIGIYLAAQEFANRMIAAGQQGAICAVSSVGGKRPIPDLAAYCASKAAVAMALRVLCLDTMPKGIRINCVAPWVTDTAMMAGPADSYRQSIPRGKVNSPGDVAAAISFLLSPDSEAIGFRELTVDGGAQLGL